MREIVADIDRMSVIDDVVCVACDVCSLFNTEKHILRDRLRSAHCIVALGSAIEHRCEVIERQSSSAGCFG